MRETVGSQVGVKACSRWIKSLNDATENDRSGSKQNWDIIRREDNAGMSRAMM